MCGCWGGAAGNKGGEGKTDKREEQKEKKKDKSIHLFQTSIAEVLSNTPSQVSVESAIPPLSNCTVSCHSWTPQTTSSYIQEQVCDSNWANQKPSLGVFIVELEVYAYGQREVIFSQKGDKEKWFPADRKPTPHHMEKNNLQQERMKPTKKEKQRCG